MTILINYERCGTARAVFVQTVMSIQCQKDQLAIVMNHFCDNVYKRKLEDNLMRVGHGWLS